MVVDARVEPGLVPVDEYLFQQSRVAENSQGIVDGGERHNLAGLARRSVQAFRGYMPILPVAYEQRRKRDSLFRRPQPCAAQPMFSKRGDFLCHAALPTNRTHSRAIMHNNLVGSIEIKLQRDIALLLIGKWQW